MKWHRYIINRSENRSIAKRVEKIQLFAPELAFWCPGQQNLKNWLRQPQQLSITPSLGYHFSRLSGLKLASRRVVDTLMIVTLHSDPYYLFHLAGAIPTKVGTTTPTHYRSGLDHYTSTLVTVWERVELLKE